MFNTPLAVEVLANIEASITDPDTCPVLWNQAAWGAIITTDVDPDAAVPGVDVIYDDVTGLPIGLGTCGTGMCFGGWALTLTGVKMVWSIDGVANEVVPGVVRLVAHYTTGRESIERVAAEALGLNEGNCCTCDDEDGDDDDCLWDHAQTMPALFGPFNELDDLYRMVAVHAGLDEPTLRVMVKEAVASAPLAQPIRLNK